MDGQSYFSILDSISRFSLFRCVFTNVRQVGDNAGGDGQADFVFVNVCGMEDLKQVLNCAKFNDLVLCWF